MESDSCQAVASSAMGRRSAMTQQIPSLAAQNGSPLPFPDTPPAASSRAIPGERPQHRTSKHKPLPSRKPTNLLPWGWFQSKVGLGCSGQEAQNVTQNSATIFFYGSGRSMNHFALVSHLYNETNSLISSVSVFGGLRICAT